MPRLLMTERSPYARKCRILLLEKEVAFDAILDGPNEAGSRVAEHNPLGKVPVLLLDDGRAIYDSPVICQWIELHHPRPRMYPTDGEERIEALRWEALSDGIADAAVAVFLEGRRDYSKKDDAMLEHHRKKIARALEEADRGIGERAHCVGDSFGIGDAALVSALGYVRLRAPDMFERGYPMLEAWEERVSARRSVQETKPPAA